MKSDRAFFLILGKMIIQKFGGTSIGSVNRIREVAELVKGNSRKSIVVLSAMSGTTNTLVKIVDYCKSSKYEEAFDIYNELSFKYLDIITNLFDDPKVFDLAKNKVETILLFLRKNIQEFSKNSECELNILAVGEMLSTNIFHYYLLEQGVQSVIIDALDYMRTNEFGEPDIEHISLKINTLLSVLPDSNIYITQGFICTDHNGRTNNLGRGGSDYSATLIGSVIGAEEIQIWTDIDGLHNNDPRYVENTSPVRQLSFDEAAELAYFGAKILHPQSVLPAKKTGIPVLLKNTMDPSDRGTVISDTISGKGFKAVAAKDNITAIKIKSGRMLMAYGFIRKVFEVFEKYRTPIDMVTTSEVAIAATIDCTENLDAIVHELKEYGQVTIDTNQSIVTIVGDVMGDDTGLAGSLFDSIKEIPVKMISYGASYNNISILVNENDKVRTLQTIHNGVLNSVLW
jgi:aspartate kinase